MESKLQFLLRFLEKCIKNSDTLSKPKPKGGRPLVYSNASFVLFFIIMMFKRIHHFKTMEKYAQVYYTYFGFPQAPSRKTIRNRFKKLPTVLKYLMPEIAQQYVELQPLKRRFQVCFTACFVDKSVFRSLGGIWHKAHRAAGIVPHPSIDTEASWGYSPYHKWRYGYGLSVIANRFRFPLIAQVDTASKKDYHTLHTLLEPVKNTIRIIVGDKGYRSWTVIKDLYSNWKITVVTNKTFSVVKNKLMKEYNTLVACGPARWMYRSRKASIEPVFSLIRTLFELEGQTQLPYRGLTLVNTYLMTTVITVQLMMYLNLKEGQPQGSTYLFLKYFR